MQGGRDLPRQAGRHDERLHLGLLAGRRRRPLAPHELRRRRQRHLSSESPLLGAPKGTSALRQGGRLHLRGVREERSRRSANSTSATSTRPTSRLLPLSPASSVANLGSLNATYRLERERSLLLRLRADELLGVQSARRPSSSSSTIRQALQESLDQTGILESVDDNYGVTGYSPLPSTAPTSSGHQPTNPYAFNLATAKALLTSHGWTDESGVMTCTSPGYGRGPLRRQHRLGRPAQFSLHVRDGRSHGRRDSHAISTDWNAIGVAVTATANTLNNLATACTSTSTTPWSMCWSGTAWTYEPNYYPSGEQMFVSGASAECGWVRRHANERARRRGHARQVHAQHLRAVRGGPVAGPLLADAENIIETSRSLNSSIGWAPTRSGHFFPSTFTSNLNFV